MSYSSYPSKYPFSPTRKVSSQDYNSIINNITGSQAKTGSFKVLGDVFITGSLILTGSSNIGGGAGIGGSGSGISNIYTKWVSAGSIGTSLMSEAGSNITASGSITLSSGSNLTFQSGSITLNLGNITGTKTAKRVISGSTPPDGTVLISDAQVLFVDINSDGIWNPGEGVFRDNDFDTLFNDPPDFLITGSLFGGEQGVTDSHIKIWDINGDGEYTGGEPVIYDNDSSGTYSAGTAIKANVIRPFTGSLKFVSEANKNVAEFTSPRAFLIIPFRHSGSFTGSGPGNITKFFEINPIGQMPNLQCEGLQINPIITMGTSGGLFITSVRGTIGTGTGSTIGALDSFDCLTQILKTSSETQTMTSFLLADQTQSYVSTAGTLNVTDEKGYRISIGNKSGAGAINVTNSVILTLEKGNVPSTNVIGLKIPIITSGSNKFAIQQLGINDSNFFAGKITTGLTGSTTEQLNIYGNILVSGSWGIIRSGSANPTTSDVPSNFWSMWRNTTNSELRLWANNTGSMFSVLLTGS